MVDFKNRIRPDWPIVLRSVVERAQALGTSGIVAFDLDSTLFDNRPRQARIVREYGAARGLASLERCQTDHFESGWDLKGAVRRLGVKDVDLERLYPDLKKFWEARFFSGAYCLDDEAIAGAAEFVGALARARSTVCYVTGRHEAMRQGTEESMRRAGMPVPGPGVHLLMKPAHEVNDDAFKREAHARLGALGGTLIAAFDNEPIHANDYRQRFPDALIIHLATDHSGRTSELLDGIVTIPYFALP